MLGTFFDICMFLFFTLVHVVLSLLELGVLCLEVIADLFKKIIGIRVERTRVFFRRVKNMVLSRYELSFKQETLFKVRFKQDSVWSGDLYWIATVKPGTFDYALPAFSATRSMVINEIRLSHMSLPEKVIYGPIHMMNGDTLNVSYGKRIHAEVY